MSVVIVAAIRVSVEIGITVGVSINVGISIPVGIAAVPVRFSVLIVFRNLRILFVKLRRAR